MRKVTIQVPITEKVKDKIIIEANKKGISLAERVREILNNYYEKPL